MPGMTPADHRRDAAIGRIAENIGRIADAFEAQAAPRADDEAVDAIRTLREYIAAPEGNGPIRYTEALELCDRILARESEA